MKTTYTDFKPLNQYEKTELLKIIEQEPDGTISESGNMLALKDGKDIRIFTISKEEVIRDE